MHLNGTGALVWPLLVEGATAGELAVALADHYSIENEVAGRDVDAFLADLIGRELVVSS